MYKKNDVLKSLWKIVTPALYCLTICIMCLSLLACAQTLKKVEPKGRDANALFSLTSTESQGISRGKEILEQSIIAAGGRGKLSKIKDTTILSELNIIPMGLSVSRVTYLKGFEKIRLDTKAMGTTTIMSFDGKTGWIMSPRALAAADMPQPLMEELKRAAMVNGVTLDPDRFGVTVTFEGRKTIEDKEYLVIKQTFKDGNAITIYIDSDTYLPYKNVSLSLNDSLQKIETETIFLDYRVVDGTKVPFSSKIIQGGSEYADITINEYRYNTGLADSFFEKP